MNRNGRNDDSRPLADRRAEAAGSGAGAAGPGTGAAPEDFDEADFAEEHAPSPSDPPNAGADAPGGQDEGYEPQTQA